MAFRPAVYLACLIGSFFAIVVYVVIGRLPAIGTFFAIVGVVMMAAWSVQSVDKKQSSSRGGAP